MSRSACDNLCIVNILSIQYHPQAAIIASFLAPITAYFSFLSLSSLLPAPFSSIFRPVSVFFGYRCVIQSFVSTETIPTISY